MESSRFGARKRPFDVHAAAFSVLAKHSLRTDNRGMSLHIPTIFLMIIAVGATLALSVGWVSRAADKDGLRTWTAALAVQTMAFGLFFLRGTIPDVLSVILGNAALSVCFALFLAAIGQFQQRSLPRALFWTPPLVLTVVFGFLMDNIGARVIVSGLIFSAQIALALTALLSRQYRVSGRGKYLLVVGFVLMIVALGIRILGIVIAPHSFPGMLLDAPIQTVTFVTTFITLIMTSNGFVLMIKERADERLRMLAMKDRLTGIWNRIRLEEAGQQEIARLERYGHPVSLIIADIDHFKQINDKFGHGAGDMILKGFCEIVQRCIRTTDVFGRWGGEEFVILLPNSGYASAEPLAERIRAAVERHEFEGGLRITASLGLAICQPDDTWESWLDRADKALYRAKNTGRNRVETESLPPESGLAGQSAGAHFVQLVWRRAYESGNALIDTQHRSLFDHANALMQAILNDRPKSEVGRLIAALLTEVDQHFRDEEAIFQQAAYPDSARHRELHADLVRRAGQLASRFDREEVSIGELFQFFAYEVVAQHLLIEDRKFYPLLAA